MALKVTKGQICDGTISKNWCHQEYYLCRKFHTYIKNSTGWYYATLYEGIHNKQTNKQDWDIETKIYDF